MYWMSLYAAIVYEVSVPHLLRLTRRVYCIDHVSVNIKFAIPAHLKRPDMIIEGR